MATGWVKSLQCKSKAVDDVVNQHRRSKPNPANCRKSVQSLKEVVDPTRQSKPGNSKSKPLLVQQPTTQMPKERKLSRKKGSDSEQPVSNISRCTSASGRISRSAPESFFPALTELPEGHPSRNVVEIIFQTGWYPKKFSGRVEMVFKVQHLSRSIARFEEYREMVKSRADYGGEFVADGEDHTRCIADGNEVMRFLCLGSTNGGAYDTTGCAWSLNGTKIITFAGSNEAHESAGGGKGRRAMLVCRVIAGRNSKKLGFESLVKSRVGHDSVSKDNGELIVFDSRAVLPCFLIIYLL